MPLDTGTGCTCCRRASHRENRLCPRAVTEVSSGISKLRTLLLNRLITDDRVTINYSLQHAVNAAITWCRLMLDTLNDPDAPWRNHTS